MRRRFNPDGFIGAHTFLYLERDRPSPPRKIEEGALDKGLNLQQGPWQTVLLGFGSPRHPSREQHDPLCPLLPKPAS